MPNPKPPQARTARARGVGRAGAGGPCGPWLSPTPTRIPRCAQRAHVRHHIAFHAGRQAGRSHTNTPGTYGTGPTCTPREGGSTVRSLAPTLSHRSQGASTSKKLPCCWLINNPPHQNLRHLRAAPRGGLERAAAGPPGSWTASATVAVRALGPCMAPERKPEASTTRASPHRMAHTPAHPAPGCGPRCA